MKLEVDVYGVVDVIEDVFFRWYGHVRIDMKSLTTNACE